MENNTNKLCVSAFLKKVNPTKLIKSSDTVQHGTIYIWQYLQVVWCSYYNRNVHNDITTLNLFVSLCFFLHYYKVYVISSLIITIHLFTQLKNYNKTY